MRKPPPKKPRVRTALPRTNVDPTRMAIAALDRIRAVLVAAGYERRVGPPASEQELSARARVVGGDLPASYEAILGRATRIGPPEVLLDAKEMAAARASLEAAGGPEKRRYVPFCRVQETLVCFDTGARRPPSSTRGPGELPVVAWEDGAIAPYVGHFGEWLDLVADGREEAVENATKLPARLKRLLYDLGFRFDHPLVGRVETGDLDAVTALIGRDLERSVRAGDGRLFGHSGRAVLALDVDAFTLTATLRTGDFTFGAEDVFRWLRSFRDENFFGDELGDPSHPDQVRDLRRAAREASPVRRGVLGIGTAPSKTLTFVGASGSGSDHWLLAHASTFGARSMLVRVQGGVVTDTVPRAERFEAIHVGDDGTTWGLEGDRVIRFGDGPDRTYPLARVTPGRRRWRGIGAASGRVVVWGAGALLEHDGNGFVPFTPDAMLDASEDVRGLVAFRLRIAMIVGGEEVSAIARFDSTGWLPITEEQVLEGRLVDLDVDRGNAYVLDAAGRLFAADARGDAAGPPAHVALPEESAAMLDEQGVLRPLHGVRMAGDTTLLASEGGVIAVPTGSEPIFYAASGSREPVRLVRVGPTLGDRVAQGAAAPPVDTGILALFGPHVWLWTGHGFGPVDVSAL